MAVSTSGNPARSGCWARNNSRTRVSSISISAAGTPTGVTGSLTRPGYRCILLFKDFNLLFKAAQPRPVEGSRHSPVGRRHDSKPPDAHGTVPTAGRGAAGRDDPVP